MRAETADYLGRERDDLTAAKQIAALPKIALGTPTRAVVALVDIRVCRSWRDLLNHPYGTPSLH
jgi:hypothetical protein